MSLPQLDRHYLDLGVSVYLRVCLFLEVVLPYLYLLLRREMCTRVYTFVYTWVYNSVHACTLLRSKYVLCRVLICAFLGANV